RWPATPSAGRGGRSVAAGRPVTPATIGPAGTPGFTVGREYSKVGWCASDTRELAFASCRVPADHLLGERGRGYAQFLRILDEGRRSEEHTSELQSRVDLVCRLLLEKKKRNNNQIDHSRYSCYVPQ